MGASFRSYGLWGDPSGARFRQTPYPDTPFVDVLRLYFLTAAVPN
jgi:hypothetical protein